MVREPVFWLEANDPSADEVSEAAAAAFGECVPAAQTAAPRRRWRVGLVVSAGAHVLLAGLLYIGVGKLVALPDVTGPALDRGIAELVEDEQDYLVMDIGVAAAPGAATAQPHQRQARLRRRTWRQPNAPSHSSSWNSRVFGAWAPPLTTLKCGAGRVGVTPPGVR